MKDEDIPQIKEICNKFYPDIESYDFNKGFNHVYIAKNDEDSFILFGGLNPLVEVVLFSNKDIINKSISDTKQAFLIVFQEFINEAKKLGYSQLHAISADDNWIRHLNKVGFRVLEGKMLVLDI